MPVLSAYAKSLFLLVAIACGGLLGWLSPRGALLLKPVGEVFLNLLFMVMVPLVFFTIASAMATPRTQSSLSRVTGWMGVVFLMTSLVAAILSLLFMLVVQPSPGAGLVLTAAPVPTAPALADQLVRTLTVSDFPELISRKAMLPLILFAAAVGVATASLQERGAPFAAVLHSGAQVFVRLVGDVMQLAPLGLLAFFAATVADTGAQLASAYGRVFVSYYAFALAYFFVGFSVYAYLAGQRRAVRLFWSAALRPSLTALGTCSSMAVLPVNIEVAPQMGIPKEVSDVVLPIGTALHKDGSVIGGVVKVLFALSLFHRELTVGTLLLAVVVAVLVGVVMGAIPSGGMMGELLILSIFGFPPETLPLLAMISLLIDPVATLLNATGDAVAAMLVTRDVRGAGWNRAPEAS